MGMTPATAESIAPAGEPVYCGVEGSVVRATLDLTGIAGAPPLAAALVGERGTVTVTVRVMLVVVVVTPSSVQREVIGTAARAETGADDTACETTGRASMEVGSSCEYTGTLKEEGFGGALDAGAVFAAPSNAPP